MNAILFLILEAIPSWAYLLATFITSTAFGALINAWMNRGRPRAEIHETRARAAKEWAEADEIRIRANFTLEEETIQRTQQMMRAQRHIFDLQQQVKRLEKENEFLRGLEDRIGGQRSS